MSTIEEFFRQVQYMRGGETPMRNRKYPSRKRIFPKKIVKKLSYFCTVIKARLNYHTKYCST